MYLFVCSHLAGPNNVLSDEQLETTEGLVRRVFADAKLRGHVTRYGSVAKSQHACLLQDSGQSPCERVSLSGN